MATPARTTMTPEDLEAAFQAVPPEQVAEILDGELVVSPRPAPRHARAATRLVGRLRAFDEPEGDEPGGWVILIEPELHLGPKPDKLVPDVAGWRRERMPTMPETAAITLAPDWVCEVLSQSTEHHDRGRKRRIYAREGVGHLWFMDPIEQTLEVYRLLDGRWHEVDTFEGDAKVRAEPFDAIELDLGALWTW
jgi:Uma2 family endonuclease